MLSRYNVHLFSKPWSILERLLNLVSDLLHTPNVVPLCDRNGFVNDGKKRDEMLLKLNPSGKTQQIFAMFVLR
jgi:hypothetical protein